MAYGLLKKFTTQDKPRANALDASGSSSTTLRCVPSRMANCAHCDKPLGDEKGIGHHDPVRHADGGSEMKLVHKGGHKGLHSCN
jgi:hypothetical protein